MGPKALAWELFFRENTERFGNQMWLLPEFLDLSGKHKVQTFSGQSTQVSDSAIAPA